MYRTLSIIPQVKRIAPSNPQIPQLDLKFFRKFQSICSSNNFSHRFDCQECSNLLRTPFLQNTSQRLVLSLNIVYKNKSAAIYNDLTNLFWLLKESCNLEPFSKILTWGCLQLLMMVMKWNLLRRICWTPCCKKQMKYWYFSFDQ